MEKPLVSVIVPVYNGEQYIRGCLDIILGQSYKNVEIIVIDDGSTDRTAQIVRQYPQVAYVYQPNSGVSAARNRAMDMATGEYIHFMDVDDLINVEFYESMVAAATTSYSDMACCGFVFERFPAQSQKMEYSIVVCNTADKIWMTNVLDWGACWRYICKLSFLRAHKLYFDTTIKAGEDRVFSLQAVFHASKIVSVPGAMYIYKNRKNSITTSQEVEVVKAGRKSRKSAEQFQTDFVNEYQLDLGHQSGYQHWQYKLLGIPVITKRIYRKGKVKWYFLNIPVFQKKEVDP